MGKTSNAYRIWLGNLFVKGHLKEQEGDGRITVRWILWKYVSGQEVDETDRESCPMVGFGISGDEPYGWLVGWLVSYFVSD
jgi:hypothetical protein